MQDDNLTPSPIAPNRINPKLISLVVIALIAIAAGGVHFAGQASDETPVGDTATTNETQAGSATSGYTDGTYTATGSYSTPGGTERITVAATLAGGAITSIRATGSASGGESRQHQSEFLENYKSLVVGKSIDSVKLSRVAGSSLTSNGFNAAIAEIKTDAKS